jgi:hypothetical protein
MDVTYETNYARIDKKMSHAVLDRKLHRPATQSSKLIPVHGRTKSEAVLSERNLLPSFMKIQSSRNSLGAISEKSLKETNYFKSTHYGAGSTFSARSSSTCMMKHAPRNSTTFSKDFVSKYD